MSYLCPLCHLPLHRQATSYFCSSSHQFDIAKEGYVNLLPVQHKRSKDPGDNKDMMQARRYFLESKHYDILRENILNSMKPFITQRELNNEHPISKLLDIGCGEGYYTHYFSANLPSSEIHGLDISKIMIRAAAKRYKNCHFLVASSQRLPFSDLSLDAIIRIYAPCDGKELARTIKHGGIVVTVTPAERHLYQLKQEIYDDVNLHDIPIENLPSFDLIQEKKLNYDMELNAEEATTLLQMTPFAWRAKDALWQKLKQCEIFHCTADFMIRVYQKHHAS